MCLRSCGVCRVQNRRIILQTPSWFAAGLVFLFFSSTTMKNICKGTVLPAGKIHVCRILCWFSAVTAILSLIFHCGDVHKQENPLLLCYFLFKQSFQWDLQHAKGQSLDAQGHFYLRFSKMKLPLGYFHKWDVEPLFAFSSPVIWTRTWWRSWATWQATRSVHSYCCKCSLLLCRTVGASTKSFWSLGLEGQEVGALGPQICDQSVTISDQSVTIRPSGWDCNSDQIPKLVK